MGRSVESLALAMPLPSENALESPSSVCMVASIISESLASSKPVATVPLESLLKGLSAKKLGVRLGLASGSLVSEEWGQANRFFKIADFFNWTKQKDPDGLAWYRGTKQPDGVAFAYGENESLYFPITPDNPPPIYPRLLTTEQANKGITLKVLALRLGENESDVDRRAFSPDFPQWTKGKDPEGFEWEKRDGLFYRPIKIKSPSNSPLRSA